MYLEHIFSISANGINTFSPHPPISNYREYLVWRHKVVYIVIIINGVIVQVT